MATISNQFLIFRAVSKRIADAEIYLNLAKASYYRAIDLKNEKPVKYLRVHLQAAHEEVSSALWELDMAERYIFGIQKQLEKL